jgi:hypothetical protein
MMNFAGIAAGSTWCMPQAMAGADLNFWQRAGYERNPVVIRHNTVAKLFADMTADGQQQQINPARRNWRGGV